MVVVIVVDGQQVTVHIGIAHQQLHVGDTMDMLQEAVELIEATWLRPVQGEPPELRPKLGRHIHTSMIIHSHKHVQIQRKGATNLGGTYIVRQDAVKSLFTICAHTQYE